MRTPHSLRTRLIIWFSILLIIAWAISIAISYVKTRHRMRYIFDAQQLVMAQRLDNMTLEELTRPLAKNPLLQQKQSEFRKANDALSFAIYHKDGRILLSDLPKTELFTPPEIWPNDPKFYSSTTWRTLWYQSADKPILIAVGQKNHYRDKLTRRIIMDHQITPWFIMIPFLMLSIILVINRELRPIKAVARHLAQRKPQESTLIDTTALPKEINPLIDALNALFIRTASTIEHERRFVSNAAHELRSPLAGLKVQADVALLTQNKPEQQEKALRHIKESIDRASRLIDQLLALSKIDSYSQLTDKQTIDWKQLITQVMDDLSPAAQQKSITLTCTHTGRLPLQEGNPTLLIILLKNLISNAIHYIPQGSKIVITASPEGVLVEDNGPGVDPTLLPQLGQRFYRPPGQKQTGSGLGLAIATQIAQLHGFTLRLGNRKVGGFYSFIDFQP